METELFNIIKNGSFPLPLIVWIMLFITILVIIIALFIYVYSIVMYDSSKTITTTMTILTILGLAMLSWPVVSSAKDLSFSQNWNHIVNQQSTKDLNQDLSNEMKNHPILKQALVQNDYPEITKNFFNKKLLSTLREISPCLWFYENKYSTYVGRSNNNITFHFNTHTENDRVFGSDQQYPFNLYNSKFDTKFDIEFTKNSNKINITPRDVTTARLVKIEEKLNDKKIKLKDESINVKKNTDDALVLTALTTDNKIIKITANNSIDITIN